MAKLKYKGYRKYPNYGGNEMERKMEQDQKEVAYNLGKTAFLSGKPCIPARDDALMAIIRTINTFGPGAKLAKAWSDGWMLENIKA